MSDAGGPIEEISSKDALATALSVIGTERDALTQLEGLYASDDIAQAGLANSVNVITTSICSGGKLVVVGVGKSGKIGQKVVATMNSFGIRSAFLHPTEALHGDLGMIGENDTILVITFSGRTPELLNLLPYLPLDMALIAVTSHATPSTCPLFESRSPHLSILLPAPIPTSEVDSFGVAAPTTSTTVALALTDALAMAVARRLHLDPSVVFQGYHPGGTIGLSHRASGLSSTNGGNPSPVEV
ncbi:hypothetical protein HO133_007639 [Letharia lupina]|uniref:SIS domain-containing protein n=1 Tax=Letharia lupina TaxID=560253 RepID=A0A8H6CRH9_9LECA|nr:uncharacterized protein HO133_007639 [Letharia lupina]KAF6227911.1 hypothetical protein HO133_007639 [Letharia lupina]